MRRYSILLEHDPDDGGYVVSVPALPGCFTQGDTIDEALDNAREAIQCHIEGLALSGEPIPTEDQPPILALIDIGDTSVHDVAESPDHVAS